MRKIVLLFLLFAGINSPAQQEKKDTTRVMALTLNGISKNTLDSNILVVIDGNIAGTIAQIKTDIDKTIPADMIQSIEILKGFRATDKYGPKGKAGVIEIYLKNALVKETKPEDAVSDSVFRKVEIEAQFAGGDYAWRRYLERSLNPEVPIDNHAPSGTYTVVVQFIVDRDGNMYDIKALTNHGYGMEEEVINVIKKGPKWLPASQGGKPVKAYRKQPVTFLVTTDIELSTNTLYAGKENRVDISVSWSGATPENIVVSVSEGTIRYESGNTYIITVDKPGKILLTVEKPAKNKKKEMTIRDSVYIEVK